MKKKLQNESLIQWLLEGDISIQYQVNRDLLGKDKIELRKRIAQEGWGHKLLSCQNSRGYWGRGFYQPKWTSSHYTLLDLRNLNPDPQNKVVKQALKHILETEKGADGGINPSPSVKESDVCINGMVLNYASYFCVPEKELKSIVDFLLTQQMPDGGFNCRSNRTGAHHSSLHTTLSVAEGICEYQRTGYTYRIQELRKAERDSIEFMLQHRLFRSDKTGKIIHSNFLKLHYPARWYYDILRALDYFQLAKVPYDPRMSDALQLLIEKRNKNGQWNLAAKYPGQVHIEMEKPGKPSRWNTLRALRVLKHFDMK